MENFIEWLQVELNKRGWIQADLAKASGIPTATISRIFNQVQRAGPSSCRKIAKALGYPDDVVMKKAGVILRSDRTLRDDVLAVVEVIADWPEDNIQLLREIARAMDRQLREKPIGPQASSDAS